MRSLGQSSGFWGNVHVMIAFFLVFIDCPMASEKVGICDHLFMLCRMKEYL